MKAGMRDTNWYCRLDLNPCPADYKSAALPTELQQYMPMPAYAIAL